MTDLAVGRATPGPRGSEQGADVPSRSSAAATSVPTTPEAGGTRPPGLVDSEIPDGSTPEVHDDAETRVIRNHTRFALSEVTFDGQPVGGATIDSWQNGTGAHCWSARVLMAARDLPVAGALAGRTRDGRVLRGSVRLVGPGPAPGSRGTSLVEWGGVTALRADAVSGEL
jgi:hypothetical protein